MQEHSVHLSVPAEPSFARSVRMMAANLAVLSEMSVDDIEDMRMAAEEGFVRACATAPAMCEMDFTLKAGELSIDFSLGDERGSRDALDADFADLLLSAVCDEYEFNLKAKTLHLAKRVTANNE